MKLVTYQKDGAEHVGALTRDGASIVTLPVPDMNTLIETMTLSQVRKAAEAAASTAIPLEDVVLLAPIPRPRQDIVCLGMNYVDHLKEAAQYDAGASPKRSR